MPTPPPVNRSAHLPISAARTAHQRYSSAAVEQILSKAAQSSSQNAFTWENVVEMGNELNLAEDSLIQAEQNWQNEQQQREKQRQKRLQFRRQIGVYAGVNTCLVILNIMLSGGITWAVWPILGWGLGLFLPPCNGANGSRSCQDLGMTSR
ncbi:MAG: 2TM domain-containing protein [Cyanobacteria bacterium J06648_16]